MNGSSAISRFFEYQKANCKKNTVRNDHFFLPKFEARKGIRTDLPPSEGRGASVGSL